MLPHLLSHWWMHIWNLFFKHNFSSSTGWMFFYSSFSMIILYINISEQNLLRWPTFDPNKTHHPKDTNETWASRLFHASILCTVQGHHGYDEPPRGRRLGSSSWVHGTNISVLLIFEGGSGMGGGVERVKKILYWKGDWLPIFFGEVKVHSFEWSFLGYRSFESQSNHMFRSQNMWSSQVLKHSVQ